MSPTLLLAGILALASTAEVSAAPAVKLVKEPTVIKATIADRPLFEYQFAPTVAFKPYVFQLYSPGGVAVLRDAPADHVHHHGLMFALEVDKAPFWGETSKGKTFGGRQVPRQTDVSGDRITQQLDWQTLAGKLALRETRTLQPIAHPEATLLTWRCRLETPPGKDAVTLSGHHYYGLGMRFLESLDTTNAVFQNSSGQPGEIIARDESLVPATWVACTGPVGNKFVTIAIFDHPGNLRYPAKKFTMSRPFTYISATLNLWKEPFSLRAGEPLDLCYGVAVWDGKIAAAQIEKTCRQWQEGTRSVQTAAPPAASVAPAVTGQANAGTVGKPNIILILADDLGWGDVGFNGGKQARTPELDKMAAEGLVLPDFHSNGAACTPTRAALMTGRYQQRSGLSNALFVGNKQQQGTGMAEHEVLIPERLREAGYKSALFGKWHLGAQPGAHPMAQGFDEFIGYLEGHMDYTSKWNKCWPDWNRGYEKFTEEGYVTHLLTRHTIEFIERNKDRPFFVYLAHSCPHAPHMLPGDPPIYGAGKPVKTEHAQPAKYVPMITEMDKGIGEIIGKLRALGIEKNTLVIFTSDNGQFVGLAPVASAGPYRGGKGDMYEGGHRVPFIAWWPGTIRPGTVSTETAMTMDLFPTFLNLAGLSMPTERPLDGISLKRLLTEGKTLPERLLFWDNVRQRAVRDGKWKLVVVNDPKKKIKATELYDLGADPGETKDLAAKQPEVTARLHRELMQWTKEVAASATRQPFYKNP